MLTRFAYSACITTWNIDGLIDELFGICTNFHLIIFIKHSGLIFIKNFIDITIALKLNMENKGLLLHSLR